MENQQISGTVAEIVERFEAMRGNDGVSEHFASTLSQIQNKINLDKMLKFDDANFAHDCYGILRHYSWGKNDFTDCFWPRCGAKK